MAIDNPGGDEPAFPTVTGAVFKGMTLRDYFAAQALVALLPSIVERRDGILSMPDRVDRDEIASAAYGMADAMLIVRADDEEVEEEN